MSASIDELRPGTRRPLRSLSKQATAILLASSFVFLCWAGGWFFINNSPETPLPSLAAGDQADLLFGAASLALFIFSIVIAILAVFGWQTIEGKIEERVERQLNSRLDRLEREMRGRVWSALGFMIGELSTKTGSLIPVDRDRLAQAIELCQAGYKELYGLGGAAEFMGLNNLVHYLCVEGDGSRRDFVLESARILKKRGQERERHWLQLTYCRAVLTFSEDASERTAAKALLEALVKSGKLKEYEKKEAKSYIKKFDETGLSSARPVPVLEKP